MGELGSIVETAGSYAARMALRSHTGQEIAAALGGAEKATSARLRRYDTRRCF
ncbi:hypothetical protein ACFY8F_40170 [Streptomyces tanashiensis]|uniref:hypothetical protein n=1 Tax=Streptomyces tanashiensis TaxID=67367 RepID=UPI0036844DEA